MPGFARATLVRILGFCRTGHPDRISRRERILEGDHWPAFHGERFSDVGGTVLAALALSKLEEVDSEAAAKKNIVTAVEAVARLLGNTAAICRKCYIHPVITSSYLDGTLARTLRRKADSQLARHLHNLKPEEAVVLALLRQNYHNAQTGSRILLTCSRDRGALPRFRLRQACVATGSEAMRVGTPGGEPLCSPTEKNPRLSA